MDEVLIKMQRAQNDGVTPLIPGLSYIHPKFRKIVLTDPIVLDWEEDSNSGTYDEENNPLIFSDRGTVWDDWTIVINNLNPIIYSAYGSYGFNPDPPWDTIRANIGSGNTVVDFSPKNREIGGENSQIPYFTLKKEGWGGSWKLGDTIKFKTLPSVKIIPMQKEKGTIITAYLTSNTGILYSWGLNSLGQLGDGSFVNKSSFRNNALGDEVRWRDLAAGRNFSLGITSEGVFYAWGAGLNSPVPIEEVFPDWGDPTALDWKKVDACDNSGIGITFEGRIFGHINLPYGPASGGESWDGPYKVASVGAEHLLALKEDGTLWGIGRNNYGQIGNGTFSSLTSFEQIGSDTWKNVCAGYHHSLGIKSNGTLWSWGYNIHGQCGDGSQVSKNYPVLISSDTDWVFLEASTIFSIGIKADGRLYGWGENFGEWFGPIGVPNRISPARLEGLWKKIAIGPYHALGIRADGSLWSIGANLYGEVGNNNTGVSVYSPIKLTSANYNLIAAGQGFSLAGKSGSGSP